MQNPRNNNNSSNSRSVFVGNIPYEATEEQMSEIFAQVGPVVGFKLVMDRETGKPKGYGFVEYRDSQTALSAMRNLNGFEINGRALRVYFAEMENKEQQGGSSSSASSSAVSSGQTMQNDIGKVLEGMSTSQLYEIMVQMKGLIQKKPEQVQLLLTNNPHLSYALLQAQVLLGIISSQDAQQLHLATQQQPQALASNPIVNPNFQANFNNQSFAQPSYGQPNIPMHTQPEAQPGLDISQLDNEKKELLEQVMKLTPEQIEKLQPHEQQQIIQLRQAMGLSFRR
jgi:cleavage stimulation factor subunit 2